MKIFHKIWLGATLCAVCACSQSEGLLEELKPVSDIPMPVQTRHAS